MKSHTPLAKFIHWSFSILYAYGIFKQVGDLSELEDPALLNFEILFAVAFLVIVFIRYFYMKDTETLLGANIEIRKGHLFIAKLPEDSEEGPHGSRRGIGMPQSRGVEFPLQAQGRSERPLNSTPENTAGEPARNSDLSLPAVTRTGGLPARLMLPAFTTAQDCRICESLRSASSSAVVICTEIPWGRHSFRGLASLPVTDTLLPESTVPGKTA